eukprot:3687438-Alexandrium_andersonii.AAC.1
MESGREAEDEQSFYTRGRRRRARSRMQAPFARRSGGGQAAQSRGAILAQAPFWLKRPSVCPELCPKQ